MRVADWAPAVDISEDNQEYLIKADLPEVKKEDVKITMADGMLTITGDRKFEKEENGKKYHRVERAYGFFARSFTLPDVAGVGVVPALASGEKCARCWQVLEEVGKSPKHPLICRRCEGAVA